MLSATLVHGNVLAVVGTNKADTISVSMDGQTANTIDVSINGQISTFDSTAVKYIVVNGLGGNDTITVDPSIVTPTTVLGGAGNDTMTAGGGADVLNGGAGRDSLEGGGGADSMVGGAGNDSLVDGTGDDHMDGGAGNDLLEGGAGNCTMLGGAGNDTLQGGAGDDHIDGGKGTDHVDFDPHAGVALSTLPSAVQSGLTTLAQGATIDSVLTFTDDGNTYYGTIVTINGVETRILVDANGNPVTHPGPAHHDKGEHGQYVGGTLVGVDTTANTITLTVLGTNKTFNVTSDTVVYIDGQPSSLANLTDGDRTYVKLASDGVTAVGVAQSTHSESDGDQQQQQATWITGSVVSVDTNANTVTIAVAGGTQTTYNLTGSTLVYQDGTRTTASAIAAGQAATLKIAADGSTVLAIGVENQSDPSQQNNNDGGEINGQFVRGTVVSVDTTANTITVAVSGGANTTYQLTSNTVIYLNSAVSTLGSFTGGVYVGLVIGSDGSTVLALGGSTQQGGDQPSA